MYFKHQIPCIDLHGKKRRQALADVQIFIEHHRYLFRYERGSRRVYIVTGSGAHSKNGIAVLRRDTIRYLEELGLRYQLINLGGRLLVDLKEKKPSGPPGLGPATKPSAPGT